MVKSFMIKQKTWIYIVASALLIILLASIIVNVLAIFNIANMMSQYLPLDIVATIIMAIVAAIIALFIFGSRYVVNENGVTRYIGFLKESIKYDDIYLMRTNSSKTVLLLYVRAEDEKTAQVKDEISNLSANITQIFIPTSKVDEFINCVKENAKNLAFEILPDEKD